EGSSQSVLLAPGGEAHVKIVLLAGGTLAGRVLDDRSFPIEGAEVEIASTRTAFSRNLQTQRDGSFEQSGIPADVTVWARRPAADRRIALRKDVTVLEGQRTNVELTLPAPRESVRFHVQNGEGTAVELAGVNVLSVDPAVPLRETLFTDADGS